jgi:phosphatidylglycerophosphate synthase
MLGGSWTHKLARICIRPLVGTPVTPNHITVLRLFTGIAACACIAVGAREWDIWGGWLWLLSAFLDRADGELARVGGQSSAFGHRLDYVSDVAVTSLFFVGAGIGLRHGAIGDWTILCGIAGGAGVVAAEILAEEIDQANKDNGEKAYPGFAGFDFDDVLYLFAPVVWLDWHFPLVVGAAAGAPAFALLTWTRLRRQSGTRGRLPPGSG